MAKMRTKEIIPEKTPQKRGTDSYSYEKACNAAKNSGTPTYRFAVGDRVQFALLKSQHVLPTQLSLPVRC